MGSGKIRINTDKVIWRQTTPGPRGLEGPQGATGPQGAQGQDGVAARYSFTFTSPSSNWIVTHNLNSYPTVEVLDSGGHVMWPDITYNDLNSITFTFAVPTIGKVII